MCMKESFWSSLCEALPRLDLARDARFATMAARLENRATLTEILDGEFRRKTTAEWLKALSGRIPVGPVNDMRSALANPFVAATDMVRCVEHRERRGLRVLTLPVKVDGERPQPVVCEPLKK